MGGATNQYNRQRSGASNGGQKSNGTVWTVNHVLEHIKLMFFSLDQPWWLKTKYWTPNFNCQLKLKLLGCASAMQPHKPMIFRCRCCWGCRCLVILLPPILSKTEREKKFLRRRHCALHCHKPLNFVIYINNYCAAYGAEKVFSLVFVVSIQKEKRTAWPLLFSDWNDDKKSFYRHLVFSIWLPSLQ